MPIASAITNVLRADQATHASVVVKSIFICLYFLSIRFSFSFLVKFYTRPVHKESQFIANWKSVFGFL